MLTRDEVRRDDDPLSGLKRVNAAVYDVIAEFEETMIRLAD